AAGNLPEQVKNNQSVNLAAGNGGQKMSQYSWFTVYFYTLGGKDRVNYLTGVGANPLRPFAETVTVPFQILLVGFRHVLRNRTVLPFTVIQTPVGCDPVVIVKNLNRFICNPHINFALTYNILWICCCYICK